MDKDVKRLKRQIILLERETLKFTKQLDEVKRKRIKKKKDIVIKTIAEWSKKNNIVYEDNMLVFNSIYKNRESVLIVSIYDDCLFFNFTRMNKQYWESFKMWNDFIDFDMSNEYLKNKITKTLNKILQWHNSRPLHPQYKKSKNGIYKEKE